MNARELMLGDWVTFRKDFPDRIDGIAIDGCAVSLVHDGWRNVSDVSPIPITPEILEKNGFRKTFNDYYQIYQLAEKEEYIVAITFFSDAKLSILIRNELGYDERGRSDVVTFARDWCKEFHVHQLQHALRFCGIDKEIEL